MDELEERAPVAGNQTVLLLLAWLWVGLPLAWGVVDTLNNAVKLFK
jgi:hypothetical protein